MRLSSLIFFFFSIVILSLFCISRSDYHFDFFSKKSPKCVSYASFGTQKVPLNEVKSQLRIPITEVDWFAWNALKTLRIDGEFHSTDIKSLEVFGENEKDQARFITNAPDQDFWRSIENRLGVNATLYLKLEDVKGRSFCASVTNPVHKSVFAKQFMQSNFFGFKTLGLVKTIKKEVFSSTLLEIELKSNSLKEKVPTVFISNETVQENLDKYLRFSNRTQDTLNILIKSGQGDIRKLCFNSEEKIKLKDLLNQHVEETTIYFCEGNPEMEGRNLATLVVSDDKRLLAVQESLLSKLVGMSIHKLSYDQLSYSPADIDFVWGDIQFSLTKNDQGHYHARKRISKSRWVKALHSSPNLRMGKSLNLDSISFDFSLATEYHKDTVSKVSVTNVHSDKLESELYSNLPDTLLSDNSTKSTIRLEDIQSEQINNSISLELEIYDDSSKVRERKYQFHWGKIDTTLTQKDSKKLFTESIDLSVSEFNDLFKKEPVLTSSAKGVVYNFNFELLHRRDQSTLQTKIIRSAIKDANVFTQSINDLDWKNKFEAGDQIIFKKFLGKEIPRQDVLILKILINDEKPKDSIDDSNVFLNWGSSILKTTPLLENSRKKKIQDQIIDRSTLLDIINKPAMLNRFGTTEGIVSAEWFINEDIYTTQKCGEEWEKCFSSYIEKAKSGDFVSLFMRTNKGNGAICQFYLDQIKNEDILGFGNTEFDSLLFKYAKPAYQSEAKPKYDYDFVWGNSAFTLDLKGSPRVYGGEFKISQQELEAFLDEKITINSSDGEVISIESAYLYITQVTSRVQKVGRSKWKGYDFDCENLDCVMNFEDAQELLKELKQEVRSLRVAVTEHAQSEEFVKVSFIDFIIENDSYAWKPKDWVSSRVDTDVFEFQFVYQEKEKTLVKLDKNNEKYKWIVDKYKDDPAVEILDMPTFKTVQRAIYTKNDKGANRRIRTTEVLSKDYTNAYTLNDYHQLEGNKVKLYWKGYQSLYGGQTYCKDDFICADGELQLQIGEETVPILRGDLVVLPEDGSGYKFIFDDVNSMEIISVLKEIPAQTNLFFENIIIPNEKGERVRLPLKFAYHLE